VVSLSVAAAASGACGVCGALAAPASAGWTRPVQVSPPSTISLIDPQVASSPTGAAATTFNEVNLDVQATASAFLALAPPHGAFRAAQAVPGAQEVLAAAYSGSTLELLTASAPRGQPCCTTVQAIRRGARSGFGRPQTLVTNAGGGTAGSLVPLANGRMLAVIAGPQRLWATEARGAGRFGALRGLTRPGSAPAAIAVTGTPGGGSAIVWTQGLGGSLLGAGAGPGATPSRPHALLTVASGHSIDGVELAARPGGLTVAWTESWNDATGGYHSGVLAADVANLGARVRARALSTPGEVASGLAMSGDGGGAEVAAWDVCAASATACALVTRSRRDQAQVVKRRKQRVRAPAVPWFGTPSRLGQIDAGASPDLGTAVGGGSVIGWITGGRVALASARHGAAHFGAPRRVSGGFAENLEVGYGLGGAAVASWTQGTVAPAVFASVLR
jgi:hypothetical protein